MIRLTFAYYCSGHGYGHATRVSAFATVLLSLNPRPIVYIISSAPKHVFSECITAGALYRYAEIDPVIVQPLAYRVDRLRSVQALESFLEEKDAKVEQEVNWLKHIQADCVLSDAAFLGCLSAKKANIPSALITNFTFDAVFSFLSTPFVDETPQLLHPDVSETTMHQDFLPVDVPISRGRLSPLVDQVHDGFRCADLLLLLPGSIPIPSFAVTPELPSADWVNLETRSFRPQIIAHLLQDPSTYVIHPSMAFPTLIQPPKRSVVPSPLLVRPSNQSVYEFAGRSKLLSSLEIPINRHDPENTRVLVVSFGGQVFHTPRSRTPSRSTTPTRTAQHTPRSSITRLEEFTIPSAGVLYDQTLSSTECNDHSDSRIQFDPAALTVALKHSQADTDAGPTSSRVAVKEQFTSPRITTDLHIWVPGAPPAAKVESPFLPSFPTFTTTPPTPEINAHLENPLEQLAAPRLLPDESWIAVICGASRDDQEEDLPDNFYIAPKDVYMPDLTAIADVLLGKLGYGGVSECLESCTPFVYVPRPLFIEEHGLRLLLERQGVGVELSRASYEAGDWADAIHCAWYRGREAKSRRRREADTGTRHLQVQLMAQNVVDWVTDWKQAVLS